MIQPAERREADAMWVGGSRDQTIACLSITKLGCKLEKNANECKFVENYVNYCVLETEA